ncbi:dihydroorotase [Antarcticibacterium flavum]|uniref:Dihydroorotase n=1 Tax=Antarcticibacterium flavum TaxID=2058175 RepID=A0A5B7X9K4_9FLAO|nr:MULTISPECIES: dihydroorotase [Antarcticibacterium]MCM4160340.1 dihydroorotase [Antarcticibacterium sp. W02-3]QCY71281.1 dihydroorotase [Antarcticibacterium flavum]
MKVLLKSVKIIDPTSSYHLKKVDIFINNGKIEDIGGSLEVTKADKEINIKDLHVSRGWFDSSVSFGEPGYEERETILNGLETAARSGFTTILLNPATNPVIDDNSSVTSVLSKANGHPVKLYPTGALTVKAQGKDLAELYDMKQAGAVAFGDYKRPISNPNLLKLALQYAQNFGGLVQSYPQDREIAGKGLVNEDRNSTQLGLKGIASLAEELHITRDLAILEYTGGKLHIPTISTAKSVKLIKEAKKKGLDVSCSVAIHNLIFTDDLLHEFDTHAKVLPPLRNKKDVAALQKGVKDGTIDMVTGDHNPIDVEHKKVEFEHALFGTTGLETAFGALLNLTGNLENTIEILTRGRKRFGLEEPEISKGKTANLSLFTPGGNRIFTKEDIFSTSKNSIFLDKEISGRTYGIICGKTFKIWE